jgi:hypothetical protein
VFSHAGHGHTRCRPASARELWLASIPVEGSVVRLGRIGDHHGARIPVCTLDALVDDLCLNDNRTNVLVFSTTTSNQCRRIPNLLSCELGRSNSCYAREAYEMQSITTLQRVCLVLSWFALVVGCLGLVVAGLDVAGRMPAPTVVNLRVFCSAAVVFGAALVSLTILDSWRAGCLFGSWFAIVSGALGLIRHSLDSLGLCINLLWGHHDPSRAPDHWVACIACGVVFGAGLVSLAIIASRRAPTSNGQANHEN